MIWQSQDQKNAVALDDPMAEQLGEYLERKESHLSRQITQLLSTIDGVPSLDLTDSPLALRLNEAIEEFSRKINRMSRTSKSVLSGSQEWKLTVKRLNDDLWEYVEVLEGSVTELFQQLDQIGFEHWNVDLARAMTSMKDELTHRIDDLIWGIRRLEELLKKYRWMCETREGKWVGMRKLFLSRQKLLDKALEPTLRKCNKFLNFRYRKFIERYTGYVQLYESGHKQLQKFYNYRILSSLDLDQQDKYKHLYLLLRLWDQNNKDRVLPRTETVRAVRSFASYPVITSLFKEYFTAIRRAVFDKSRMIKDQFRLLFIDRSVRQPLLDNVLSYRNELSMLNDVATKYRKFHLHTDPSKKKGLFDLFRKERTPPEVQHLKDLENLEHEVKALDVLLVNFHSSLECDPEMERKITPNLQSDISRTLHEMAQPLASQDLMRRDAKVLLNSLHGLDEMGSFDPKVVDFTRKTLVKAMRVDWKYHVLQELPLFHHVVHLHHDICSGGDDRVHMGRLHKFQRILDQLGLWIGNNETLKYAHDIELDINDIKAYLQDFFASVQRLEKVPEGASEEEIKNHPVTKANEALLDYLYLFGKFFHKMRPDNPEVRMIRKQLLFVDQYFEEVERKLHELA